MADLEKLGFTGNRNVDRLILSASDDRDLLNALHLSTYLNKLGDEFFFNARTIKNFPALVPHKPPALSWRNFYLSLL